MLLGTRYQLPLAHEASTGPAVILLELGGHSPHDGPCITSLCTLPDGQHLWPSTCGPDYEERHSDTQH